MATKHNSRFHQLTTLGELNRALSDLSLSPITRQRLDQILATEPRQRLVKALNQARTDQRALIYLQRFFEAGAVPAIEATMSQPPVAQVPVEYALDEAGRSPQLDEQQTGRNQIDQNIRQSKHVYGSRGALCFEPDETRGGVHTICMDAADSTGPKQYNWDNKLRVQLTRDELLQVTAVLFGFLPCCEGKNHGANNSKGFKLEDQGDKLFMRVFSRGHNIKAVPIFPEDAFYVAGLVLGQLKKNMPWLAANEILATLQRVHANRRVKASTIGSGQRTQH